MPIHTIAVGRTVMPEDLELGDVLVPDTVLPDSTLSARVTIRHDAGGETRLKVYDGDRLLASKTIELRPDTNSTTAWVDLSISDAGPHQLDFTLEGLAGEQELRNNSRSRLVNVADQDYQILYFEGEPRWEYKFLRRAVHGDEELHIVSLLRVSPNKFYRQGPSTRALTLLRRTRVCKATSFLTPSPRYLGEQVRDFEISLRFRKGPAL